MKKQKWIRKGLAMLLAIAMVVGLMPGVGTIKVSAEEGGSTVTFTATAGTAGDSDSHGYAKLIDGNYTSNNSTKWCVTNFSSAYIIFAASEPIFVKGYSIVTGNDNANYGCKGRNPKDWTLYGCNNEAANSEAGKDSTRWAKIHSIENDSVLDNVNCTKYDYTLTEPTAEKYQYFKLEITAIRSGNVMQMGEFILDYSTCAHTWEKTDDTIAPTCTEGGYNVEKCSACQETRNVANGTPATGHTWGNDTVVQPTCTKKGYTLQTCSVCRAEQKTNIVDASAHNYVNGTCSDCGAGESESRPIQDENDVYQIGTAGELCWFAGLVNGTLSNVAQNDSANAVLTADITINDDVLSSEGTLNANGSFTSWVPIGKSSGYKGTYKGTFDGQNHTISGLYFNDTATSHVGLFGYVGTGGKISNMGVIDSYFCGGKYVGSVCGLILGGTIENCYSTGTVSGNECIGGVCGNNNTDGIINNCYSTGKISGSVSVGGVCGLNYNKITNCYFDTDTAGRKNAVGSESGDVTNVESKTTKQFKSGEVCFLMNNGKTDGSQIWYQNIDNQAASDTCPTLDASHGTVYQCTNCTGVYSNTKNKRAEHTLSESKYIADDDRDTITVTCGKCNEEIGTVIISAPDAGALIYDNSAKAAMVSNTVQCAGFTNPSVSYKKSGETFEGVPTDAGEYTASITLGTGPGVATVSVEFTISPKSIEGAVITLGDSLTFNGKEQTQKVAGVTVGTGEKLLTLASTDYEVTEATQTNVGDYTLTVTGKGNFTGSAEKAFLIAKAEPEVAAVPTVAERTYDPNVALKDIALTEGTVLSVNGTTLTGTWSWEHADVVPTVNNDGYTAVFTPTGTDKDSYKAITKTITVPVTKATPYIKTAPTAAAITYGNTLKAATLTGGSVQYSSTDDTAVAGKFAWEVDTTKPAVADSDKTAYKVVYTPTNKNYNTVETDITVTVNKAASAPGLRNNTMEVGYSKKKVSDITLPEGWAWQDADKDKALTVGTAVKATAVYTGADKGNYETESVEISITRQECAHDGETEVVGAVEATCKETGFTGDTKCKACGVILMLGTVIEKLTTHKYVNGVCSVCDDIFKTTVNGVTYQVMTETGADGKPVGKLVIVSGNEIPQVAVAVTGTGDDFAVSDGKVTVPSEITGSGSEQTFVVTKIAENAFAGGASNSVTEIVVPATVTEVGTGAFGTATAVTFNGSKAPAGIADAITEGVTVNVPEEAADSFKAALGENANIVEVHTHTFDTKWTYDDTYHWHAATCGHETEVSDKAAHTFGSWVTVTEATEDAEGAKERSCSCGYKETATVDKLAHTIHVKDEGTRVEPTCEKKGSITYKCTKCGEVMEVVELVATGHKWDGGKVTKKPTETAEGVKTYTCSVCGKTKTEAIPKKAATTPKPPKKGDVVKNDKTSVKVEVTNVTKKEVEYKEPANKKAKTVSIPATVKIYGVTYKVTQIADNAFKGCTSLTSVTLSRKTTKIGANAFNGCKKLKTIKITSTKLTSKTVSKNAFKGLTKATTIKVPKKKLKAYKKLFKKKGLSSKVKVKGY